MELNSKVKVIREFLEIPVGSVGTVTMCRDTGMGAIGIKFDSKDAEVLIPFPSDYIVDVPEEK